MIAFFLLVAANSATRAIAADHLPTYDDFRRVDRMRRLTGQLESADLLNVTHIDRELILRTVRNATNDYQIAFGAAELITDWPTRRALFSSALSASASNTAVGLRFAAMAVVNDDVQTALPLLRFVESADSANVVPWFLEYRLGQTGKLRASDVRSPSSWSVRFRDYGADAARARVHTLEAAGFSAYAARRLGCMPEMPVVTLARESAQKGIDEASAPLLLTIGQGMQDRPTYLITELVGQTIEGAALRSRGKNGEAEASMRGVELEQRRNEIKGLLTAMERDVVDLATESEMIDYFNNVLAIGEEAAMRHLAATVRSHPLP